jgi:hypothetical protein
VTRNYLLRFSAFLPKFIKLLAPQACTSAILQQRVTRTASALLGKRLYAHVKVRFSSPLFSPVATAATCRLLLQAIYPSSARRLLLQAIYPSSGRGGTQRAPAACGGAWRAGPCSHTHGKNDNWPLSEQSSTARLRSATCMSWDVIPRHYSPFLQICLLLDDMVSRRHAIIDVHDDAYYLTDLGSLNGCHINDVTVPAFVGVRLNAGDSVVLGAATYICMQVDERCECSSALELWFVVRGHVTASTATSKNKMRSQSAQEGTCRRISS